MCRVAASGAENGPCAHDSLISYARSVADKVIVSLFVNPTQFGPNEDLEAYPRDFEKDSALVRELGGDVLYAPEPENMYAPDHATWVEVPALANTLCGLSRPIHFRGVCTVVLKLFMLAQPSLAVFGEKDWQQLAIIKKMVSDLNVPQVARNGRRSRRRGGTRRRQNH